MRLEELGHYRKLRRWLTNPRDALRARKRTAPDGVHTLRFHDGRTLPLNLDPLFNHSLFFPDNGLPFAGFTTILPASAETTAQVVLPANPAIVGATLHFATLSADPAFVGLVNQLRHVTRARSFLIQ